MASQPDPALDTAALLTAIVESSDDAVISTDLAAILRSWNRGAEHLYGYTAAEAIGQPNRLIIPDDRLDEEADVIRRVRAGEAVSTFDTVRVRKDGARIDVSLTASAIRAPDGRIVGVSKISRDISRRLRAERQLREASERLAAIVEYSEDAIVSKDLQGVIMSWNRAAERMFGYTAAEAIGRSIRMIVPGDRQDEETTVLERVGRNEAIEHYETIRCRKDGSCLPISLSVSPILDVHGTVVGASKIARDISERKQAEAQAETEHSRTLFLAEMAGALATSLDYRTTLTEIANLAVPSIADWCAIDVLQEDGALSRLALAHVDPTKIELATEVRRRYESDTGPYSVAHVIKTATPAMISETTDDMIAAAAAGDEERVRMVSALGLTSYVCVPLVVRGRALGAITLATAESGRRYTDDDLRFAEDIASRVALAVENARSYEQLQRANRLKDEFLATLSHELRTPLNAILGYARIIRGGIISGDKLTRALETIERNSMSLTQMVEDILDVSRIVAGKMRLNVQPVELPSVVREAVETVKPAAEAKHVPVHTVIDPRVGPIAGDPDRLRQILWNLLTNAIRFTPRDGQVQVRLERIDSSVEIAVSDTGAGISADFLPHIFERFRLGEGGMARQHRGLGLGLAIVRNLVEMHGGSVSASSSGPGTGATFRVRLPIMIVHPPATEERRVHPRQEGAIPVEQLPDLSGTRVLAVDDEPDALRLLAAILESAGATVTTVTSGAAALEHIRVEQPEVLVADLGMSQMDGFELIQRLRQSDDPKVRNIPAAALTAYARSEDRARTLQSGFEMHLSKPIDPVELVSAVKALARRQR